MIAECPEGEGVITAEIDLKYLEKIRATMPVRQHHRPDLYGKPSIRNKGLHLLNLLYLLCKVNYFWFSSGSNYCKHI